MLKQLKQLLLLALVPVCMPTPQVWDFLKTEVRFMQYQVKLAGFFSMQEPSNHWGVVYHRKSIRQRRRDGELLCNSLNNKVYTVESYSESQYAIHKRLYANDSRRFDDESTYMAGVMVTAVNTICTQHQQQLHDYLK
jgi:hypothetical protein